MTEKSLVVNSYASVRSLVLFYWHNYVKSHRRTLMELFQFAYKLSIATSWANFTPFAHLNDRDDILDKLFFILFHFFIYLSSSWYFFFSIIIPLEGTAKRFTEIHSTLLSMLSILKLLVKLLKAHSLCYMKNLHVKLQQKY